MHRFIWIIPLLPLAGACVNGLLGRRLRCSERAVAGVAVGSIALAFLLSVAAVYSYGYSGQAVWPKAYVTSDDGAFGYTWIAGGAIERASATEFKRTERGDARMTDGKSESVNPAASLSVEWSYQLDPLSAVFLLVVTGVGLPIFIFAIGYMRGDEGFYRFFAYLCLFISAMLVLVLGSNFVMMFVGWEGVGLCSYLLIGYYFDRAEAGNAARKAFMANRIGDAGFVLAIFGIIAAFGTTQFTAVMNESRGFALEPLGTWRVMSWIALGLFIGAIGKSAQIPLAVWLPDAMAGPTPVSALIHAATMVTAGVYLLARANAIFQHSQTMMLVVAIVGAFTALWAATIAVTQHDIKKILAYSTISQLGLMFLACGTGAFVAGVFHVVTHAFFKALLFLCAGAVIHEMYHEQDVRRMGGLKNYMPRTHLTFLAGWLAICGIFPFSGFWSKDEILWGTASTHLIPGSALLWLTGVVVSILTAFYMTRLVALMFWGDARFMFARAGGEADEAHAHAYAEGDEPHDARTESAGDRPHHEPGEHVGMAYVETKATNVIAASTKDASQTQTAAQKKSGAHTPHEAKPAMLIPLFVLASLAVVGGFVGLGSSTAGGAHIGGRMNILNWLDPIIWNARTGGFGKTNSEIEAGGSVVSDTARASGAHTTQLSPYGNTTFSVARFVERTFGNRFSAEWIFILLSLAAAITGIGAGMIFYVKPSQLPQMWAKRLRPLYAAGYNKYWLDEIYGAIFTQRIMDAARVVHGFDTKALDGTINGVARLTRWLSRATGVFDRHVVDGIVNAVAGITNRLLSPLVRASQTGLTQNYALVMVLGLVAALALFFGVDILTAMRSIFALDLSP
ncbi:MAG: NADH-quinone oxidoreductase subunit L [Pyrinomonadaceae bacterium]